MSLQETAEIEYPYCGERAYLLIDYSIDSQDYIENRQVCCRPMNIHMTVNEDGLPQVEVHRDDE